MICHFRVSQIREKLYTSFESPIMCVLKFEIGSGVAMFLEPQDQFLKNWCLFSQVGVAAFLGVRHPLKLLILEALY